MQPNTLLDSLLDEAGMSHAGLASRVNQAGRARGLALRYEHTAVSRWLRGQRPRGQVPDLICGVLSARLNRPLTLDDIGLGLPGDVPDPGATPLAGFVERATALWRSDEQRRPHIVDAPAVTGTPAVMPVWEWENPPEDCDVSRTGPTKVGPADINLLKSARAHYELMYRRAGGVATRARIVGFLNVEAAPLLRGTYSDAVGRQLHRATGGLVAVAGICAYDSDAHGLAQRYFHQGLRLAKASGDRGLGAYVIALLVNQSLASGGVPPGCRLRRGRAAHRGTPDHPGTRRGSARDAGQVVRPPRGQRDRAALHRARGVGGGADQAGQRTR